MADFEVVVVGAGVIGLAIARILTAQGFETLVLEKNYQIFSETSSRNSEVIHAGIYYPVGSHKQQLCISGKQALYQYVASKQIPYQRCGKLIIASSTEQDERLESIRQNAIAAGVTDLHYLTDSEVMRLAPGLAYRRALFSPSTGIIDTHHYGLALLSDIEANHGYISYGTEVQKVEQKGDDFVLTVLDKKDIVTISSRYVINACGLYAQQLSHHIEPLNKSTIPPIYYARGCYYQYTGENPFKTLIYPIPSEGGLGIHATVNLANELRFGPNVEWSNTIDYHIDNTNKLDFITAIRDYLPHIDVDKLQPDFVGIRPKLSQAGNLKTDFMIQDQQVHGLHGYIALYGIESPGLTASLAIADHVQQLIKESL